METLQTGRDLVTVLPNEILLHLLQRIRASTTFSGFINVLLTCKRLYISGRPIGLQSLNIAVKTLGGWFHSARYIGDRYVAVRHLTITLELEDSGMADAELSGSLSQAQVAAAHEDAKLLASQLVELTRIVKTDLKRLSTFVLMVKIKSDHALWCRDFDVFLPRQPFAELIEALPSSCISLSLNTGGYESLERDMIWYHNHDLCCAVGKRMSLLHNLRMGTRSLCPWFFLRNRPTCPSEDILKSTFEHWLTSEGPEPVYWSKYSSKYNTPSTWLNAPEDVRKCLLPSKFSGQALPTPDSHAKYDNLVSLLLCDDTLPNALMLDNQAGKMAKALVIATHEWGLFPVLRDCHVTGHHLEDLSSQELKALAETTQRPDAGPAFQPFSDLFIYDVVDRTTTILPFRWLIPEYYIDLEDIKSQKTYAFHDITMQKQWYGSLKTFNALIDHQLSGGWVISHPEKLHLPKSVLSDMPFLDVTNPFDRCVDREKMEEEVRTDTSPGFTRSLRWFDRADAAVARKYQGILDSWEVRDYATGELGTTKPYTLGPMADLQNAQNSETST